MSTSSVLAGFVWSGAILAGLGDVVPAAHIGGTTVPPMILAGEIVISHPKAADTTVTTGKDATRQMESAREQRTGQTSSPSAVIIVPEEDEGMLSPRRGGSGAAEQSARARTYRQSDSSSGVVMPQLTTPDAAAPSAKMENATQRARDNRNRATEYRTGGEARGNNQVAVVGKDGLPIIDCSATENAAGRIGDDTRSGSVVILVQDRNQVKVRCR